MNRRTALLALLVVALAAGVVGVELGLHDREYEWTTVEIEDGDTGERLATVDARIADTPYKRYVGLSNTESLAPDEGMLFVHDEPDEYSYVMRDMAFGIDGLFVDADGTVTTIHSAEPESRPYTSYSGHGQYVLEVRYGYADDHGIEEGDRVVLGL